MTGPKSMRKKRFQKDSRLFEHSAGKDAEAPSMFLTLDTMIPILKLYFIGTFVTVLAVFYSMVDSIGALAHHQDHSSMWELEEMKAGKEDSLRLPTRGTLCGQTLGLLMGNVLITLLTGSFTEHYLHFCAACLLPAVMLFTLLWHI
ncbi:hypothetical protein fugu_020056 [Takifugu bimaculatus]|uniref:Uncharacterized protein n=1 Tax=Takifugu bimaculatus TaxID=433685 RepID=A0A4Z2BJA9_9TELE|nr:hypothetical protein fugu_020056 [Takifugu bimaculatus]